MYRTKHSVVRCQQRGIKLSNLGLIISAGSRVMRPGGVYEYYISKKDRIRLTSRQRQYNQDFDKLAGTAVLATRDGVIITAYHKRR